MNRVTAELIGTVFYIGKLPLAPGTWASIFAVLCWYFLFQSVNHFVLPAISIFLFLIGGIASDTIVKHSKEHDPSRIVIDEWVGQWVALSMMPINIRPGGVAVVAFRIFDIIKPGPVRKMEKIPGGWGIMADDVMAGIMAYFVVLIFYAVIL